MPVSGPILAVVGFGTLGFTLAASSILTAQAKRALDLHALRTRAVVLRNDYAREVLALHAEPCLPVAKTIPAVAAPVPARAAA